MCDSVGRIHFLGLMSLRKIEKVPLMLHKPLKWNWSLRIEVGLFLHKGK